MAKIPTKDLVPGQYFKHGNGWALVVARPIDRTEGAHDMFIVNAYRANGGKWDLHVYNSTVEIFDEDYAPQTFTPAYMRKKAAKKRAQADELHHEANAIVKLMLMVEGDSVR